jgi:hypothetical protein
MISGYLYDRSCDHFPLLNGMEAALYQLGKIFFTRRLVAVSFSYSIDVCLGFQVVHPVRTPGVFRPSNALSPAQHNQLYISAFSPHDKKKFPEPPNNSASSEKPL